MFDVGKIVYLFDRKSHKVVPCRIIEKVNSISLEGESTHHIIQTPSDKTLKLEDYKGPQFYALSEVREFLLEAAKKLIDETLSETVILRDKKFPGSSDELDDSESLMEKPLDPHESHEPSATKDLSENINDSGQVVVDLGNGQTAKVNLPNGF